MIVERSTYRGRPVLSLRRYETDKFPLAFGLKRAKMILEAYEDIVEFVKKADDEKAEQLRRKEEERDSWF